MINKELILIDEELTNRDDVLQRFADIAYELDLISSQEAYIETVLAREEEMSTSIGFNICIPHGRDESILKPFVGYMKTTEQFSWDGSDKLVDLILIIGVPNELEGELHLKILSQISRKLIKKDFREKLSNSHDVNEVYQILKNIEDEIEKTEKE